MNCYPASAPAMVSVLTFQNHIKERVKAATDALEAQFDERVAAAVEAELDLLTSPEKAA